MTLILNRSVVLETLEKIVADKGEDYVYAAPSEMSGCMYAEEDDKGTAVPSCIWGHVVAELDSEVFVEIASSDGNNTSGILELFPLVEFEDQDLERASAHLQDNQDTGMTWGTALHVFRDELSRHDS